MNSTNEKKLAKRATELGNSTDACAFVYLEEMVTSESPLVRRRAALAIGKLGGIVPADSPDYKNGMLKKTMILPSG